MGLIKKLVQKASLKALDQLAKDENFRFARNNYLFKDISDEAFLFIIKRLVERNYAKNELVFKQENPGVCLFIVKQGKVEIYFEEKEQKTTYAFVGKDELFGEISAVSSTYRTATAKAAENDTILLALSSFDLKDLDKHFPQDSLRILKGITDTILKNLIETTHKYQKAQQQIRELEEKKQK